MSSVPARWSTPFLVLAALAWPATATATATDQTLAQLLDARGDCTVVLELFDLAGMADELSGETPRTLFAPNDAAFAAVPGAQLDDLRSEEFREDLRALLSYHLVSDRWTLERFGGVVRIPTLQGGDLALRLVGDDSYTVDAGTLLDRDLSASNGVLHVVDEVLVPKDLALMDEAARFGQGRHEYTVDLDHSAVLFRVAHMEVGTQWGQFRSFAGKLVVDTDDPTACSVILAVDVTSIDTGNGARDGYLMTADFFAADDNPGLTFRSTSVLAQDTDRLEIAGELTLLGVTRPLTFVAEKTGEGRFGKGIYKVGYEAELRFLRSDFGMTYGIPSVAGDEVRVIVALEANRELVD